MYNQNNLNNAVPGSTTEEMYGYGLLDVNDILATHSYDMKTMDGFKDVFPQYVSRLGKGIERANVLEAMHSELYLESLDAVDSGTLNFNESQKTVHVLGINRYFPASLDHSRTPRGEGTLIKRQYRF